MLGRMTRGTKEALGLPAGATEAPRAILSDDMPCAKCIDFAEKGYVTFRALPADKGEELADGNGNISTKKHFAELYKILLPEIWRVKLEAAREIFTGIDLDKIRFTFLPEDIARKVFPSEEEINKINAGKEPE